MTEWFDVAAKNALAVGEHLVVEVEGIDVAIFKLEDGFYALQDVCTHDGAEIASGIIEGDKIICPRHGAKFCIKTGGVKCAPAYEDIETFEIKLEVGRVKLREHESM
jgi:3-phenylpropionate/trans-cinnamate dioxygenase ferredoxin subunit